MNPTFIFNSFLCTSSRCNFIRFEFLCSFSFFYFSNSIRNVPVLWCIDCEKSLVLSFFENQFVYSKIVTDINFFHSLNTNGGLNEKNLFLLIWVLRSFVPFFQTQIKYESFLKLSCSKVSSEFFKFFNNCESLTSKFRSVFFST